REVATAKALCADCAVQSPCLEFALSRPDLVGIWAATTPSERAVLRRAARAAATSATPSAPPTTVVVNTEIDEVTAPASARAETVDAAAREQRAPVGGWLPGEAGPPAPADGATFVAPGLELDLADIAADELLTPAEAARRLGVTPNTVTRWSRAG